MIVNNFWNSPIQEKESDVKGVDEKTAEVESGDIQGKLIERC